VHKSESGLWLPGPARRRPKPQRPDSTDYKQAATIDPEGKLTYDAYVSAAREEWIDQFTPAERSGPITFEHYMTLSFETLQWRITEDIPKSLRAGSIDRTEAKGCTEFFKRLRTYTEQFLRSKGIKL